jgi:DNA mismatch repair protein MutL
MTLITKEATCYEGIKLTIEQNSIVAQEPTATQTGTTIEIRDLFYNIPVRKKFLKKRETEIKHIQQTFDALCLAHPALNAKLYSDSTLLAHYTPATSVYERYVMLYAHNKHTSSLLAIDKAQEHNITIEGVIANHQQSAYDRNDIVIFVNRRWVKHVGISRAIINAYSNVLPPGRFPIAMIMVQIPGSDVDINVHPRKEEVRFIHTGLIEDFVCTTIKKELAKRMTSLFTPLHTLGQTIQPMEVSRQPFFNTMVPVPPAVPQQYMHQERGTPHAFTQEQVTVMHAPLEHVIIGQHAETYILAQSPEGLLIVDQHAAHECILYNRLELGFEMESTVPLLFPEIIEIRATEVTALLPYMDLFCNNGIVIEQFGETQLRVSSLAVFCKHIIVKDAISTLLAFLNEQSSIDEQMLRDMVCKKLRAQIACKAAVKAGDILDQKQMQVLLSDLQAAPNKLTCPHGRPTYWLISTYEMEKKFKRR